MEEVGKIERRANRQSRRGGALRQHFGPGQILALGWASRIEMIRWLQQRKVQSHPAPAILVRTEPYERYDTRRYRGR